MNTFGIQKETKRDPADLPEKRVFRNWFDEPLHNCVAGLQL